MTSATNNLNPRTGFKMAASLVSSSTVCDSEHWLQAFLQRPNSASESTSPLPKFLQLPRELRNIIYREAFGKCSIVAALDANGHIIINQVLQDNWPECPRGFKPWEPSNNTKPWSVNRHQYIKITPAILLTCHQIHDEAKEILQATTWFAFTISEPHLPAGGAEDWWSGSPRADISTFLPWMKHVAVTVSIFEVSDHWIPVFGSDLLYHWFTWLFDVLDQKAPHLVTLGLEMEIDITHSPDVLEEDPFEHGPTDSAPFQGILNAWQHFRFPGMVQLEPSANGVFQQFTNREPPYNSWLERYYPQFWHDFSEAENTRLVNLRHPDVVKECATLNIPIPRMYEVDVCHRKQLKWDAEEAIKDAARLRGKST